MKVHDGCRRTGGSRTSNPSVNSRRIQNLNALFGVAYREDSDFQSPSWATWATESQMENEERIFVRGVATAYQIQLLVLLTETLLRRDE